MKTALAGLAVFLALVALLVTGALPKLQRHTALASEAKNVETSQPLVNTVVLEAGATQTQISLPASMQAIQEAAIYARIDGYLKKRLVDIGDRIKAGTVMAEIEAPEMDQQLAQTQAALAHAVAALAQVKANQKQTESRMLLAKVTVDRWKQLVAKGVVSKQDGDEKQSIYDASVADFEAAASNVKAAEADISAQQANMQRMQQMQSFEKVVAPFDGIVTARTVDPGALITAGSASDKRELFRMASTDELRIFVSVPQAYSAAILPGQTAIIRVGELQGRTFPGKIIRTADVLDPSSRTLLTEVHIPNTSHLLRPGMFSSIQFNLDRSAQPIRAPAGIMMFRADGPNVAVIGPGNKLHFTKVVIGRDYGATVELLSGVNPGDRAVLNPTDDLTEGMTVEVAKKEKATKEETKKAE
jgi:RND family efflux transporter MFP subunit